MFTVKSLSAVELSFHSNTHSIFLLHVLIRMHKRSKLIFKESGDRHIGTGPVAYCHYFPFSKTIHLN